MPILPLGILICGEGFAAHTDDEKQTFASKRQLNRLATGLASLMLTQKFKATPPAYRGRNRRRALPRKLRNVNYQQRRGTQSFGLNSTSLNFEKSYTLADANYNYKIQLIDVFNNSEFVSKYTDWEYMKLEGFQVLAFPMMDKQQVYMNVQWNINDAPDNLKSDDSTKLFVWPHFRNQTFNFIPPNVALHFPQTASEFVRVNLRKEWITLNDMRVAYLNSKFPCELYFERTVNTIPIDIRVFVKVRFRRSTSDPIDSKTPVEWKLLTSPGPLKQTEKVVDEVEDDKIPNDSPQIESEPSSSQ